MHRHAAKAAAQRRARRGRANFRGMGTPPFCKVERGSVGATLAVARGQGGRIATTSVRAGRGNDGLFARGTVKRRDTWVPPYTALLCRGRCLHRPGGTDFQVARRAACGLGRPPLRKRILQCVGEGLSCPPLCQPIPGHCRGRQPGHFLEIGSLLPPPAALRRFPLPRATARVAPTDGNKKCAGYRAGQNPAPTHDRGFTGAGRCWGAGVGRTG